MKYRFACQYNTTSLCVSMFWLHTKICNYNSSACLNCCAEIKIIYYNNKRLVYDDFISLPNCFN